MPKYSNASSRINLDVGFNVDKSSLQEIKSSLQQLQKLNLGNFAGPQKELLKVQDQARKVEKALTEAFNPKLNTINLEKFNAYLAKEKLTIQDIASSFSKAGAAGQTAFNRLATSVLTTNLQLKETHSLIQNFGTTMLNTIKWGFASSIINNFTGSIQQAVSYVEGLDKSLTNIRIVTGDSREEMTKFAEEANRASQSLGRSTMDYTKAALSYYQQGLSDEQVAARTEATLKAQNITGAGDEMADYLTAVWNGYRVANEEAELYVDKMAAVADSSASNMAQLATAMSKVASTADMMGVPMDSLNAQIATIVATTRQAPESVGNALKTIYTRVADIKTGSQDAQISLGNYSSKMKEVGIDVLDSSGRFRDLGDIIEQIGGKWSGLSKEQQIYLARTMAGQRQINNLLALFNNWDKYSDLVTTSMESQGTTMEKNARYMESLGAHLNQLNAAQQRLKSSMIDSDSFKGLVDFGTGAVTVFANLIEAIGGGGTAILGLGGIFTNVFSGIISRQISNVVNHFQTLKSNAEQLKQDINFTQAFGSLEGFSSDAVTKMVEAKKAAQQFYSVLSEGQINSYQGMVKEVGQLQSEIDKYQNLLELALAVERQQDSDQSVIFNGQEFENFEKFRNYLAEDFVLDVQINTKNFEKAEGQLLNTAENLKSALGDQIWNGLDSVKRLENIKLDGTTGSLRAVKVELENIVQEASSQNISPEQINKIKETIGLLNGRLDQAESKLSQFQREAAQLDKVTAFTKLTGGIMSITSAVSMTVNAFKALKNESLSTGEKVLQVVMGLASAAGMAANAYTQLGPVAVKSVNVLLKALTAEKVAEEGANAAKGAGIALSEAATVAKTGQAVATGEATFATKLLTIATAELEAVAMPVWAVLAGIAGVVAGVVVVSKLLYDAWTKDARAAQQAAQNAAAASQAYDKVKESADQLKSSLEEYNSFQDTLASLTRGTEEWNQAIQQSNELVLDLINKFPELAEQVKNVNGQLVLDQDAIKTVQQNMDKQVQAASLNKAYAAAVSRDASITSQATDLGRQFSRQASNINTTPVNISGQQMKIIAQELNKFEAGQLEDIGIDQLNDHLATEAQVSLDVIEAIRNEETGIKQLQNAIRQNTNATKLQYEALAANSEQLQNSTAYQNGSDIQKRLMQTITASDLENATDSLANQWQKTLTNIDRLSDARNQDWSQQVLDAVSASVGEQLNWATNSIRGMGQNRQFVFVNENNEEITRRADQIASMIAATEALDGLSDSVTNASQIIGAIEKYQFSPDNKEQNQAIRTAIQEYIANQNFDNISKDTLKQLTNLNLEDIFSPEEIEDIANVVGVTTEELTGNFQDLANSTIDSFGKAFEQLPNILSTQVQEAISDEDLTVGSEKAIVDSIKNAIANGGKEAYQELLSIYEDMDNVDGFEKVVSDLDLSNTSVQQLSQKLKEAGVETGLTNDQLAKYIELIKQQGEVLSPEQNYANIHQIVDGLKAGDTVDPQQAETLKAAGVDLDAFFTHMADGSYKLKTDAQEFYDYVNQISLQPFVDEIKTSTQHLRQLTALQEGVSDYNYEDLNSRAYTETGRRSVQVDSDLLSAQLDTLQALDIDGMQQKIVAYQEELQEYGKLSTESMEEVYQAIKDNVSAFSEEGLAEKIKAENQVIQDNLQQLRNSIPTDEDVDVQAMYALRDALMQNNQLYEDTLEPSERLSQDLQDNAWAAEDVAQSILRYDAALATLQQNYDDWLDILENGSMQQQAELFDELANAYGDLLDMDGSQLSSDFVNNADNLRLFQEAANGSEEAYNQLLQAAGQDIAGKVYLNTNQFYVDRDAIYQSLYDLTGQQWDDIQVGAILDDTNFIAGLQNMINAAHMTADQATSYLASMGVDAEVIEDKQSTDQVKEQTGWVSTLQPYTNWGSVPVVSTVGGVTTVTDVPTKYMTMNAIYTPTSQSVTDTKENSAFSLKVISAKKSSGGNFKFKKASHGGGSAGKKARSGSGSKKGSGGSGSTPKAATQAKLNTSKIDTKAKTAQTNPYQQQQKAFQRQGKILDNLQNKQKKLVNKDRLKNLKDQNKTLEEQVKILNKELDISRNAATENSTANYAKRLRQAFGSVLRFDSDGQISDINALEKASVNTYNAAAKAANDAFEKQKAKYNDYLTNTFNKYTTQQQQEAHKAEKERWDQRVKNAEDAAKKAISAAQEEYKTREDLIKSYNDAWEADQKRLEQIRDLQDQIIEKQIAISQATVNFSIDTGQAERDWLKFEKKFIKKIDNDDFLGQAKASVKQLMSYFNSEQIQNTANQIQQLQKEIAIMQAGGFSLIYGDDKNSAQERLEELMKQQMDDLQEIQDLVDDIKDNYLDAIDDAKDKMDQQINQYERINDLIDHNVKLTELIYGDKAYKTLDKYYNLMQKNNQQELDSLKRQQEYWQERMNQQVIGSDAWQQFKKNLDDTTDNLNDKLEEMIDNLSKKWQNKVDGIIEKLNNGLTGGRGLDYLDEQWDYINNYDDNFLDTVNSVMGTREVERLYKQASDDLSQNPKQQQKINKLMNQQLKILKEKNKLTEYDIERAKALLQVEQARMALEDARNNKTKMRLRRDSQGNYTYQYVADEQKLSDLQDSLAKAQNDLYNMDKQHYKQNLNDITDTWRDFLEQYVRLSQEAQNTLDKQERARIIARRDLLMEETNKLMEGLTEDNKYTLGNLNQSFFDDMQIDPSQYSAEEQMQIMNQNIPQMKSNIQDLANQIVNQGGILNVTADAMKEINKTTQQYDANVEDTLGKAGTNLQTISQVVDGVGNALDKNIQNTEKFITANEKLIANCHSQIEEIQTLMDLLNNYLDNAMSVESLISNLRGAYNIDQILNGSKLTADVNIPIEDFNIDTTFSTLDQYQKYLSNMAQKEKQLSSTEIGNIWAEVQNKLNNAEQGTIDLKTNDLQNMFKVVQMVRNMTNALSGFSANQLASLGMNTLGSLMGVDNNTIFDQEIHIDAHFPNVTNSDEIIQAFEILPNIAAQKASSKID